MADESDLFQFAAPVFGLYTIETSGATDTFLNLYGPDSQDVLLALDDDSGPELNSRIEADLAPGIYYVRVRHYSATGTGAYEIRVSS